MALLLRLEFLGIMSRNHAHRIPFIVKINYNELLSIPNRYDQTLFDTVKSAWDMGAIAVSALHIGKCRKQPELKEIAEAFQLAHELGMMTILGCYARNNAFNVDGVDYHSFSRSEWTCKSPRGYHTS